MLYAYSGRAATVEQRGLTVLPKDTFTYSRQKALMIQANLMRLSPQQNHIHRAWWPWTFVECAHSSILNIEFQTLSGRRFILPGGSTNTDTHSFHVGLLASQTMAWCLSHCAALLLLHWKFAIDHFQGCTCQGLLSLHISRFGFTLVVFLC